MHLVAVIGEGQVVGEANYCSFAEREAYIEGVEFCHRHTNSADSLWCVRVPEEIEDCPALEAELKAIVAKHQ